MTDGKPALSPTEAAIAAAADSVQRAMQAAEEAVAKANQQVAAAVKARTATPAPPKAEADAD